MKKFWAICISFICGLIVYGLLNTLAEFFQTYVAIFPLIFTALSIYCGVKIYSYLGTKWDFKVDSIINENKKSKITRWILYILFISQLFLSIGVLNEFSDYVALFVINAAFLILEIWFIYHVSPKKGSYIFLTVLILLSAFQLLGFLTDGVLISDKYPAQEYYSTYGYVLWMLIGGIIFEIAKVITLYLSPATITDSDDLK